MHNKDFAGCGMGVEMEAGCVMRDKRNFIENYCFN